MKLDRSEIAVLGALVLVIVTVNAWWRVKDTGSQAKAILQAQDASLVDGQVVWPDGGDQ